METRLQLHRTSSWGDGPPASGELPGAVGTEEAPVHLHTTCIKPMYRNTRGHSHDGAQRLDACACKSYRRAHTPRNEVLERSYAAPAQTSAQMCMYLPIKRPPTVMGALQTNTTRQKICRSVLIFYFRIVREHHTHTTSHALWG